MPPPPRRPEDFIGPPDPNPNRKVEELLKAVVSKIDALGKLQRQTLDQTTKQFRDDRTYKETNKRNTASIADAVGGGKGGAEGGGKQKSKLGALAGAARTFVNPGELFKTALFTTALIAYGRMVNALTRTVSSLTPNIKGLADIEKQAAKINLEVNSGTIESGKRLADAIGKEVTATTALKFAYASHEVGIATHGKGMRNLFRATLRTGEDFKRLASGIRDATFGMGNAEQLDAVAFNINRLTGVLNKSRTELVTALGSNSAKLKDSLAVLSGNSLAYHESTAILGGIIRDPALFKGILSELESLFVGPEGLQKSMMLGVLQQRGEVLTGADRATTLTNILTALKAGFERTETFISPVRGTQIAPQMLDALTKSGRVNAKMFRAWQGMEQWLRQNLGLKGDLDPAEIVARLMSQEETSKQFVNTFETFKTTVMRPIMDALIEVAALFKGFFKNSAGTMRNFVEGIASWTVKIYYAIINGFSKLATILDKTGEIAKSLMIAYAGLTALRMGGGALVGRWKGTATLPLIPAHAGVPHPRGLGARARMFIDPGRDLHRMGGALRRGGRALPRALWKRAAPIAALGYLGYELANIWGDAAKSFDAIDERQGSIADILAGIRGDTSNMSTIASQNQATVNSQQMLLSNIQQFATAQIKQTTRVIEALGTLGNLSEEQILAIREEKELNVEMMVPFTPGAAPGLGRPGFHPSTRRR